MLKSLVNKDGQFSQMESIGMKVHPVIVAVLLAGLAGCSATAELRPDPVDVSGRVTFSDGRPVKTATLHLQPTGDGLPTTILLKGDGKAQGKVIPGRYVFYFAASFSGGTLKAIPERYQEPAEAHVVTISAGTDFEIRIEPS